MKVAIHQPNFVPWLPYFYKMAMVDEFVLLRNVQFEKNGYQNRFWHKDKWITKPVVSGTCKIKEKDYVGLKDNLYWSDRSLFNLNLKWIEAIKETLDINTPLSSDSGYTDFQYGCKTNRLIDILKSVKATTYVTNESAKDKYLDEKKLLDAGISIEYCKVPKNLNISIFEAFEQFGIEGTIKQLPRKEKDEHSKVL